MVQSGRQVPDQELPKNYPDPESRSSRWSNFKQEKRVPDILHFTESLDDTRIIRTNKIRHWKTPIRNFWCSCAPTYVNFPIVLMWNLLIIQAMDCKYAQSLNFLSIDLHWLTYLMTSLKSSPMSFEANQSQISLVNSLWRSLLQWVHFTHHSHVRLNMNSQLISIKWIP